MYEYISGKLASKNPGTAVVEAGGIGYRIYISSATFDGLPAAGESVRLWLHKSFNTEQGLEKLFGFADERERMLFLQLLEVQRVGPTVAMRILSNAGADVIITSISGGDIKTLQKVKGVGPKMAERLVVELREPLSTLGMLKDLATSPPPAGSSTKLNAPARDAIAALVNLGYRPAEAEKAVEKAASDVPGAAVTELIRLALRNV
jgi:Holliday junction DNA helicase RuvA